MKSIKTLLIFYLLFSFFNCRQLYKIEKDKYGQPILNEKTKYSFDEKLSDENSKKIDTTAYYVQIFEERFYNENEKANPQIIIFHNDGFFKRESVKYFGKWDKVRGKNSVYYGGKYKIIENRILFESFGSYPEMKKYHKTIDEAKIQGDKIVFGNKGSIMIYEKRKSIE